MKVIFVIVSLAGGGAERVISILANEFVKKNIEVTIMMTAGDEVAYELAPEVELLCIGKTSGGSMMARIRRIHRMRQVFRANKDSIIISFGPGTSFFTVAATLFMKPAMIISERNDPAVCPHKKMRDLIYRRADKLVFQTNDAMNCFPRGIAKKGIVIPNPVVTSLPSKFTGVRNDRIVTVGRLEEQKNHKMLIEAFALFSKDHPGFCLHIYGEGSLREPLGKQIREKHLEKKIILEGFSNNVLEQIQDAAMFVLSSDYEGISNSLLEAMALGLPVISTDCPIGGSAVCIRHKENGLLTRVGDAGQLCEAISQLADDKEYAERLGNEAEKIRSKFSQENIANRWIELMKELR